jgi:hypothetical protein
MLRGTYDIALFLYTASNFNQNKKREY